MGSKCKQRVCKRRINKRSVRKKRVFKKPARKRQVCKQTKCKRQVRKRQVCKRKACKSQKRKRAVCNRQSFKQPICKRQVRNQYICKPKVQKPQVRKCQTPVCKRYKQKRPECKRRTCTRKSYGSNINVELAWQFLQTYKPTTRDLYRCMKPIELKELCRRVPCYVDLSRWNPLYDIEEKLWEKGRLQKRCKYCKPGLILDTYRRYRKHCTYLNSEIQEARFTEWMLRKKDNILNLRLWAFDRNVLKRCNRKRK